MLPRAIEISVFASSILVASLVFIGVQTVKGAAVERVPPRITLRYPTQPLTVVRDPGVSLDAIISDASGLRSFSLRILSGGVITTRTICGTVKTPCPARLDLASFAGRQASFVVPLRGQISVVLKAVDAAGNIASQTVQFVYTQRLLVRASHTPDQPSEGEIVHITAVGENEFILGNINAVSIRQLTVLGERTVAECRPADPTPRIVCEATIPYATRPFGYLAYYAVAEDASGVVVNSVVHRVLGRPTGADDDADGLTNVEESIFCTDPNNPDSDHDSLLDGWEVRGQHFADGVTVDLPGMGANPCSPDAFVELDWSADAAHSHRPSDMALTNLSNLLLRHGIVAHIDTGQWGGGKAVPHSNPDGTPYFIGNNWLNMLDGTERHFDPHRLWSFFYGIIRHVDRGGTGSAYKGNIFALDIADGRSPSGAAMVHEIGHLMGLGHGGESGDGAQTRNGRAVWYDGTPNPINYKPNYFSLMNYAYLSGIPFARPVTRQLVYLPEFSDGTAHSLDENALDERTESEFAVWLRSRHAPPGAIEGITAVFSYKCVDPRDGLLYQQFSDGTQTLRRLQIINETDWRSVPTYTHPPGIDWNCDGRIDIAPVRADINHDGAYTTIEDKNDLQFIPGISSCRQMTRIVDGVPHPTEAYLAQGGDPPTCDVGYAGDIHTMINNPLEDVSEQCDRVDNDNNGIVDDGCADSDTDRIADLVDNCPRDANADQTDHDGDGRGDACSVPLPVPRDLRAEFSSDASMVTLTWTADQRARGYVVYRRAGENEIFKPVNKKSYPTVPGGKYTDIAFAAISSGGKTVTYYVVPVSATTGAEGVGASITMVPNQSSSGSSAGVLSTPQVNKINKIR